MRRILFLASFLAAAAYGQQAQMPARDTWGVDRANGVFRLVSGEWRQVPGALRTIQIAGDGSVWGISPDLLIWKREGENWVQQAGQLSNVAPGDGKVIWGTGPGGQVWRRIDNVWAMVEAPRLMRYISAGVDGTVIALDTEDFIWRFTGTGWQQLPGLLRQISVANARTIYGVNAPGEIWRWTGTDWTKLPGLATFASATADGEIWVISQTGELLCWNGSAWLPLRGSFTQIAVGAAVSGKLEEDSSSLLFTGSWTRQTEAAASGGAFHMSSAAGASVRYQFTGDSVMVWRALRPDGGALTVTVDGRRVARFDCYFREPRWQVPSVVDGLGEGAHTLVMTVDTERNPASSGSTVVVDAIQAPQPIAPTAAQVTALERLNQIRRAAGLPPARLAPGAILAAQGHAEYLRLNPTDGHNQVAGKAGFIGEGPAERGTYFGYGNLVAENIWPGQQPVDSINSVLNSIYHRVPLMDYSLTEFGIGSVNGRNVQKFGIVEGGSAPPARLLTTYPGNNQVDVPLSWDVNESPRPLPAAPRPLGYPFSLHIAQARNVTQGTDNVPTQASLVSTSGQAVEVAVLDSASDQNIAAGTVFVFPRTPLANATTYVARISGNDQNGNAYDHSWRFTTAPASLVETVIASMEGVLLRVLWSTAGPAASTHVEYGPTQAYGSRMQGVETRLLPGTFFYAANLDLAPGTYHYRVVATDAQGNTRTSGNQTFEVPNVPTAISRIFTNAGPTNMVVLWDTNRAVASTEVQWGLTTAYGNTAAGQIRTAGTNQWMAVATGLTAATTYNYRIVARDAQGNVVATSPNGTFTTNAQ